LTKIGTSTRRKLIHASKKDVYIYQNTWWNKKTRKKIIKKLKKHLTRMKSVLF